MTIEEILAGESKNVEFKENLPEKSIKYMKSVVAFANGTGGKIIFGIADKTREVVGFDKEDVFKKMDAIANAVSDAVNRQLFRILLYRRLMVRLSLWWRFLRADSVHIISKLLAEMAVYMSVLPELPALPTSIW